ncbi:MAG TPA: DNA damage-inducible protein D [Thermodesulfovibrionales bacterium]|jgi:DNA-damage-inducible protein D|nr:DNA damage-inducible protein D [Thermodesulfovibrionales bacterium]
MMNNLGSTINELDKAKQRTSNGGEYWMGRSIQTILGYQNWDKFENVIDKAKKACESTGIDPNNHFRRTGKMVEIGSGAQRERADYFLTRYACYLIAMNGETSKLEIGTAQSYFAVQTRRQEIQDKLTADERRLQLRERVKNANISLTSTAKKVGVQKYAIFHDAGYQGLYEMGLADIKRKKGISEKENLLDRAGRTELAANEFRITQTEEKLVRDRINNERDAINMHRDVGREVRSTIKKLGGTLPEDLLPEESIKKLTNKHKKEISTKETPIITE